MIAQEEENYIICILLGNIYHVCFVHFAVWSI
jgi:hypothetical protein